MKKYLALLSVLMVAALFTGCSFLSNTVEKEVTTPVTDNLFNYDNVDTADDEVLVRATSLGSLDKMLAKEGSEVLQQWPEIGWALVSVPAGETADSFIKNLRTNKEILMAELNMEYQLDKTAAATSYDRQWGFENMNAEAAWDITTGSEDVIVAIIDTGLDVTHPEFAEYKTIVAPHNATGDGYDDEVVFDADEHGTHVAGIAAANGAEGVVAGVAWDCPIMPIRAQSTVTGGIYTSYLTDGMMYVGNYAKEHPTKKIVVNMSIGGHGYSFAFKDAIDYAFEQGVLLITSAGNDSKRVLSYPSAYNGVVSVAASTPYDTKADFSTIGHWNSIAAPGVLIYSTLPVEYGSYGNMQGTSMASPYVCGAAALLLSHDKTLTPLQIKNQIEQTARGTGFSEELGYGIIDIAAMLGDLEPMAYGSLEVISNIVSDDEIGFVGLGVITVFDDEGTIITWGTTGEEGNHNFYALKPGTYEVNLSYYNIFEEKYELLSKDVTIVADADSTLDFEVGLPSSITRESIKSEDIEEATGIKEVSVIITDGGYYEFETSRLDGEENDCDTVLSIYDADDKLVVTNDDSPKEETVFSFIGKKLAAGTYKVVVEEFMSEERDNPRDELKCHFEVTKVTLND